MNNISTTKEQSERLMKCGVLPETADMAWVYCKETAADGLAWETEELVSWPYTRAASTFDTPTKKKAIPAWSLSALLEKVLPKRLKKFELKKLIKARIKEIGTPTFLDGSVFLEYDAGDTNWYVKYGWGNDLWWCTEGGSPIEAVVQAVELLHLNGYKFN